MSDPATNPLRALESFGQAVWLDFVERKFLADGGLKKLIDEDGVTGVTSNPSIFEKAMGSGEAYDEGLRAAFAQPGATIQSAYEAEAIADIKAAARDLRPVFERTGGRDGYVSLEVAPDLAENSDATIADARRLWAAVGEPNLMIKIPGTAAGVPAIRAAIADGINVNVTLLFSQEAYQQVALAYLDGLEARVQKGEAIGHIASVASFFVSRIDSAIDKKIDERLAAGDPEADALKAVRGKVAIANAKLAYAWWHELVCGARWRALAAAGAEPQRLLWASTGTKDKAYRDTLYVDTLIGAYTVNTMPPATLEAFRDHGTAAETLTSDLAGAQHVLAEAERLGLDLAGVTDVLVVDGVKQFEDAATKLFAAVGAKQAAFASA